MSKATAVVAVLVAFAAGYFFRGFTQGEAPSEEAGMAVQAPTEGAGDRVRVNVGLSPTKGPKDAKVTIVEFSDFQ